MHEQYLQIIRVEHTTVTMTKVSWKLEEVDVTKGLIWYMHNLCSVIRGYMECWITRRLKTIFRGFKLVFALCVYASVLLSVVLES
jgi:hypothetical protein